MGAINKDEMQEIVETLKEARQNALLGNYERAIVYFKGILHDMGQLIQTYDERKTPGVSRADLQKYRTKFETELRQVEEMNNTIASFRNMVAQPAVAPPVNHNNYISAYNNMPVGGGHHGHHHHHHGGGGLYDPFETPERDPDVWPPPPPIQNKNRISNNNYNPGSNMAGGGGYQVGPSNYSPKHKDYRGKQVMGGGGGAGGGINNDPKSANNARPQLNKGTY